MEVTPAPGVFLCANVLFKIVISRLWLVVFAVPITWRPAEPTLRFHAVGREVR